MPRKSGTATVKQKATMKRNSDTASVLSRHSFNDILGEEDVTSSEDERADQSGSFHSPVADDDQTNYSFDYTSVSARNTPKKSQDTQQKKTQSPPATKQTRQETFPRQQSMAGSNNDRDRIINSASSAQQTMRQTKSKGAEKKTEKKRNYRKQLNPKTAGALREIKKLQASTKLLMPKLPFSRVVREIFLEVSDEDLRITPSALEALQESTEMYAVQLFEDSYMCTLHRDRKTLMPKDISLARFIRGRSDPGNR